MLFICCWIIGVAKILTNDTINWIQLPAWRLFRSDTFAQCHVTSVVTGSVPFTHHAVGAGTMHGIGTGWFKLYAWMTWLWTSAAIFFERTLEAVLRKYKNKRQIQYLVDNSFKHISISVACVMFEVLDLNGGRFVYDLNIWNAMCNFYWHLNVLEI